MDQWAPSAPGSEALHRVAVAYEELGRQVAAAGPDRIFEALTGVAATRVNGARAASITTYQRGRFTTVAATDERARGADAIQYELGSGPCIDAIVQETLYHPGDLLADDRWPVYGRRVSDHYGFASMLSYRLAAPDVVAGLNIYADQPHAFDEEAVETGLLLATHGGVAVAAASSRRQAENLERALVSSRDIGVAIGVLMARHQLTREQAFNMLRVSSQRLNRKVRDIALDVADTGTLPTRPDDEQRS